MPDIQGCIAALKRFVQAHLALSVVIGVVLCLMWIGGIGLILVGHHRQQAAQTAQKAHGSATSTGSTTGTSNAGTKTTDKPKTTPTTTTTGGSTQASSQPTGGDITPPDPNYYVSIAGSDTNDGHSLTPWRTIQKAVNSAPAGATIVVTPGTYDPFTASTANQTITGSAVSSVLIKGQAGVRDVVQVTADGVKLAAMTVYGCVPNANPGDFEANGSTGIRVNDGADNVTITQMVVRDSHGVNGSGLAFGCYGILVHNAKATTITANDIYHNGAGVYLVGGGQSTRISSNAIHDNDVIIRNTLTSNDDYGGVAISFVNTAASPGPVASGNTLYNNVGSSHDYGTDGGGFEIYNASNVTMSGNSIYNNENILETGTSSGGGCSNNVFSGNTNSGKSSGSSLSTSIGMILRCAQGMVIDNNTFNNIDYWVYDISTGGTFGASITGLTITHNRVTQSQKVYDLELDPSGYGMNINNNLFHFTGGIFSSYVDNSTSATQASWVTQTGFDAQSSQF